MDKTYKEGNQYFALNSVKSLIAPTFHGKKKQAPLKIFNKDLVEENYRWDLAVQRFIKIEK